MNFKASKLALLILILTVWFTSKSNAQETKDKGRIEVAMRMIGHQVLLNSSDSTSLILPIERKGNRYKIQFGSEFQFTSGELVPTIGHIMQQTKVAESYRVEVESCDSSKIIYSYEIGDSTKSDIIPCAIRPQPKACYNLLITLLDAIPSDESIDATDTKEKQSRSSTNTFITIAFLLLAMLFLYQYNKKRKSKHNANLIAIGAYQFDKRNMKLTIQKIEVELSSKEADLLSLLHSSANTTLEREHILKVVWGDEGDYIGRTLDVFISKLRKKLEADPSVKIVNVRGIGYKLILNS